MAKKKRAKRNPLPGIKNMIWFDRVMLGRELELKEAGKPKRHKNDSGTHRVAELMGVSATTYVSACRVVMHGTRAQIAKMDRTSVSGVYREIFDRDNGLAGISTLNRAKIRRASARSRLTAVMQSLPSVESELDRIENMPGDHKENHAKTIVAFNNLKNVIASWRAYT